MSLPLLVRPELESHTPGWQVHWSCLITVFYVRIRTAEGQCCREEVSVPLTRGARVGEGEGAEQWRQLLNMHIWTSRFH